MTKLKVGMVLALGAFTGGCRLLAAIPVPGDIPNLDNVEISTFRDLIQDVIFGVIFD